MEMEYGAISKEELAKYDGKKATITLREGDKKSEGKILVKNLGKQEIYFCTNDDLYELLFEGDSINNEHDYSYCIYSYDEEPDVVDNRVIKKIQIIID